MDEAIGSPHYLALLMMGGALPDNVPPNSLMREKGEVLLMTARERCSPDMRVVAQKEGITAANAFKEPIDKVEVRLAPVTDMTPVKLPVPVLFGTGQADKVLVRGASSRRWRPCARPRRHRLEDLSWRHAQWRPAGFVPRRTGAVQDGARRPEGGEQLQQRGRARRADGARPGTSVQRLSKIKIERLFACRCGNTRGRVAADPPVTGGLSYMAVPVVSTGAPKRGSGATVLFRRCEVAIESHL